MAKYRFLGKSITRAIGTANQFSTETIVKRGDIFEPTEAELNAFGDLLQLIPEMAMPDPEPVVPSSTEVEEPEVEEGVAVEELDFSTATVLEVLSAVESGEITARSALDKERAGKGRKTLVVELKRIV